MLALALLLAGCGDPLERVLALEGDPASGAAVFVGVCATCHGPDGAGGPGRVGPDLRDEDDTTEELAEKVLWGWGAMDGFAGELPARDVADVVAFVRQGVQRAD